MLTVDELYGEHAEELSSVGMTMTAVNGEDFRPAYVGGVDGNFKWRQNAYKKESFQLRPARCGPFQV